MAAMKPRTGDGPLEVTKEGRGIVMRVPLEGGGRLVVEMTPDEATALSALRATRFAVEAAAHAGDEAVTTAILDAIAPYRMSDAGYRLENTFTYLIAQA